MCHFPQSPELCVTMSPVVVDDVVVVVVVVSTGCEVGVLVGVGDGRGVGSFVNFVGEKVGAQGMLHASVTRHDQLPLMHSHVIES